MVDCDCTLRIANKNDVVTNTPFNNRYVHVCNALEVNGNTGSLGNSNLSQRHTLYEGYEQGLTNKFSNDDEINSGCDKLL